MYYRTSLSCARELHLSLYAVNHVDTAAVMTYRTVMDQGYLYDAQRIMQQNCWIQSHTCMRGCH